MISGAVISGDSELSRRVRFAVTSRSRTAHQGIPCWAPSAVPDTESRCPAMPEVFSSVLIGVATALVEALVVRLAKAAFQRAFA